MSSRNMNIAILFVIALSLSILPSSAEDWSQEFLEAHNAARSEVGLEPMVWDAEVAAAAMSYANTRKGDCAMVHSGGPFGENIAWGGGELAVEDAVKLWDDEKQYYDRDSSTCQEPNGGTCLHYTQVVWRDSLRLGCAKVRCSTGGTFIVCNYDPPGNNIGQRPY